jgi:hypothetical protein
MVSLEGSLITRLGDGDKMEFIREFSVDGYATYLDSYLVDIYLPHRTLIILAVVAITLRSIKLFRELKRTGMLGQTLRVWLWLLVC